MQSPLYFYSLPTPLLHSPLTPLTLPLPYRQPDGFAFGFGFDDFLFQLVEPLAAFEYFSDYLVSAYEDAALRVLGGVACMDADALPQAVEVGASEKKRKPHLEFRTPRDDYCISNFLRLHTC